jgi:hypothetical protein
MLTIYISGVILSFIFAAINYLGYLSNTIIKHPHWLFYVNEIFWNLLIIGGLSWIGVIIAIASIINRCNNKINRK